MIADALGLKCAPAHWCLAESADDFGDIVFLKKTDGGDAGGSSGQAGAGVGRCDAAQGQDRDVGCAGFAECGESGWLGIRIAFFPEDWGEDGEGGCLCCGLGCFCEGVAGDGDDGIVRDCAGEWPAPT